MLEDTRTAVGIHYTHDNDIYKLFSRRWGEFERQAMASTETSRRHMSRSCHFVLAFVRALLSLWRNSAPKLVAGRRGCSLPCVLPDTSGAWCSVTAPPELYGTWYYASLRWEKVLIMILIPGNRVDRHNFELRPTCNTSTLFTSMGAFLRTVSAAAGMSFRTQMK